MQHFRFQTGLDNKLLEVVKNAKGISSRHNELQGQAGVSAGPILAGRPTLHLGGRSSRQEWPFQGPNGRRGSRELRSPGAAC